MSNIYIERQTIQDSEGTELFFIDNYVSENEFACDISLTSVVGNSAPNETTTDVNSDTANSTSGKFKYHKNSSSGLSGGAIAAIVISLVVVIGVVVALIALGKKGILFGPKPGPDGRSFDTTVAKMDV